MAEAAGFLDFTNITRGIAEAIGSASITAVGKTTQNVLTELGQAFSDTSKVKPLRAEANNRLAQSMRKAVLHSYDQVVTARKTVPSYRQGAPALSDHQGKLRYSGGALRRTLEDRGNYVSSAQGIKFIDLDIMDKGAEHWYRLNFGAEGTGPRGGRAPYSYLWEFEGQEIGRLELSWAPSEPYAMPHGVWSEGQFTPRGKRLQTLTAGIGARRFLDAGLDRFSKDFTPVYSDLLFKVQSNALQKVRSPSPVKVTARP